MVGCSHGPGQQSFKTEYPMTTLAAIAIQGKSALDTVMANPTHNFSIAFHSPLQFVTIFSPLKGHYIESQESDALVTISSRRPHRTPLRTAYEQGRLHKELLTKTTVKKSR